MSKNVPQTEIKAIRGIIELSDSNNISKRITIARRIYSEHDKQSFLGRCLGSITGRNNRERLQANQELSIAVEHLNSLSKQLSDEVARNGERIRTNTSLIGINARAIACLSKDFMTLAEENNKLQSQFKSLIQKQKEYNTHFQTAINSLEAQQYIDRLAESWEAGNIFQGYHPVIQTALFIDCVFANWKDVLNNDEHRKQYIKDRAVNILKRLYPHQGAFPYKYGDFALSENDRSLESDLAKNLQICLPEYNQNNGGFLTYKALENAYPIWGDRANLNIFETEKSLVTVLIKEGEK